MEETHRLQFIGVVVAGEKISRVRIFPEFCSGLQGVRDFSHLIIVYWFHLRDNMEERRTLQVVPRRHHNAPQVGVFASRSPSRPNPIVFCVVELIGVEGCDLLVKGLDALQNSPILDIKPYLPKADSISDAKVPQWTLHGPSS